MHSTDDFFPEWTESRPMIYAYSDDQYPGCLKVGYTSRNVDQRIAEQYSTKRPGGSIPYKIVLREPAIFPDGSVFKDYAVFKVLESMGIKRLESEWFECSVDDVKAAIIAVKEGRTNLEKRSLSFKLRPEQKKAIEKTIAFYKKSKADRKKITPKFLWNAKMRFGKTFTAFKLAKEMEFKRVLILTFKPVVASAWRDDLIRHIDFEGWQFISRPSDSSDPNIDEQFENAKKKNPIVCFGSFQDFLGVDRATGGIKAKNEWVHTINWDLVIFDEYHFGAWKDNAKKLFESDDDKFDEDLSDYNRGNAYDESWLPITAKYYLYLSGTPFRALSSGEFIEDQIYSWTYSDEQRAKAAWNGTDNPYASLPRMVMMTYKMPDSIERIAKKGETDEFDLNSFFSAEGEGENARFVHEDYVQKWLDLIRGSYLPTTEDDLKLGASRPPYPYSDNRLLNVLSHTLWFLPNVASCYAMANLLAQKQNTFYHDYKINICAGAKAGIGLAALKPVQDSMDNPLETKTITLSCGKLTTGVTIKPWTGILMLRNLSSPETYFQAAFRVQSPWEIIDDSGRPEIIKKDCYLFDFALNRALNQISDYSRNLDVNETNPEKKVADFISFLPVLAYDHGSMRRINAAEILDITMAGISATHLARRWESALLVNVDNQTLARLLASKEAMDAISRIVGLRSTRQDIQVIINKSEAVKKVKKSGTILTDKERKDLTDEEKEYKSKRKQIQEKLIKFATRIPVFMYLTDFREYSLKDVITQLEPGLFMKVTGLDIKDFELLVSLNVFNSALMNDAVYKFKRYEDASLIYSGIDKHPLDNNVGLYDTTLTREEYDKLNGQQAASMVAPASDPDDQPDFIFQDFSDYTEDELEEEEPEPPKRKTLKGRSPIVPELPPNFGKPKKTEKQPFTKKNTSTQKKPIDIKKIVGKKVTHTTYGKGTVIKVNKNSTIITVQFSDKLKKQFPVPSAFNDKFLTLCNK